MDIAELLSADRVVLNMRVRDKAALLTELARLASSHAPEVSSGEVEAALLGRERLGSTGLGAGFALPHARLARLDAFVGLFARLARPIDYSAIDDKPVDLVFLLLIPAEAVDHVAALAAVSRLFRDPAVVARVRKAGSTAATFDILTKR
jgi:PTS system nitrogen regulatory IIA component